MKKIILSIFALFSFVLAASAQATTTDAVFQKFYNATGGVALWNSVTNYTIKQSFRANSSSDYDMMTYTSLSDQFMSKTKTILKRDFIYGVSSTDGWLKIPIGSSDKAAKYDVTDLSDKEKENMRRDLKDLLTPFLNYQAKGYIASYVGVETINGKSTNHIELSGKNIKYDLYFDATTGLVCRKKQTLASGEIITEDYTNFAKSDFGITYPSEGTLFSSIDKRNYKVTTTTNFNTKFDASSLKR